MATTIKETPVTVKKTSAEYWLGHKYTDVRMASSKPSSKPSQGKTSSNDVFGRSKANKVPASLVDISNQREKLESFLRSAAESADNTGAALSTKIFLPSDMWRSSEFYEELDSKSINALNTRAESLLRLAACEEDSEKRLRSSLKQPAPKFRMPKSKIKNPESASYRSISRSGTLSPTDDASELFSPISHSSNNASFTSPSRLGAASALTSKLRSFRLGSSSRKSTARSTTPPLDQDDACSTLSFAPSEESTVTPASPPLEELTERKDESSWPSTLRRLDSRASTSSIASLAIPKGITKKPFPKLSIAINRHSSSSTILGLRRTQSVAGPASPEAPMPTTTNTQAALDFYQHAIKTLQARLAEDPSTMEGIQVWRELLPVLVDDIFAILRAHWDRSHAKHIL